MSTKRLYKEYTSVKNMDPAYGITVELHENQLDHWIVYLSHFDTNSVIQRDLEHRQKMGLPDHLIELRVSFPVNYPYEPPFIHVVRPRFLKSTAHITGGGAICAEMLTTSGWSNLLSMESILIQIKVFITEANGRIVPYTNDDDKKEYTETEARASFKTMARAHGW